MNVRTELQEAFIESALSLLSYEDAKAALVPVPTNDGRYVAIGTLDDILRLIKLQVAPDANEARIENACEQYSGPWQWDFLSDEVKSHTRESMRRSIEAYFSNDNPHMPRSVR